MYAYRKAHNTTTALIDLLEPWMDNINANLQNITMFLDLLAAFDIVNYEILLIKPKFYSFSGDSLDLLR